eukprot:10598846-Lingulodinium_polyedra.AAC.1
MAWQATAHVQTTPVIVAGNKNARTLTGLEISRGNQRRRAAIRRAAMAPNSTRARAILATG